MKDETEKMIGIIKEISQRFDAASRPAPRRIPASASTDVLVVRCPVCMGQGACSKCDDEGVLRYRFNKEIIALATALEGKSALEIAQVLSGLAIGMTLHKQ